jgi:4-diphosphocytidyl-2-C-methyl-D-erythritol kinase
MIRLTACAKVNLFLEITGKRPDGYHTLSTLFQTISLADELTLSPAADLKLTCSDPSLPTDERNLVLKAAIRLRTLLGEERGAHIHLEKKAPMGAGLGGGSSDAAATLKGLLKLWGRNLATAELRRLAVSLGADVPFFLEGGLCAATGIGDELKSLPPLPKTWLVLVYPGFGVSTKEAYGKVRLPIVGGFHPFSRRRWEKAGMRARSQISPHPNPLPPTASEGDLILFNRFESLVFPDHPELPKLKQDLIDAGATAALMSGSGSSVFGLAKSRAHGSQILSNLQKKYNQCWLVHTV